MEKQVKAFKAAFPHTIPVIAGFVFLGMAYGVLMSANGYSAIWSFLMSLIAFCGSMQFVAINLLCVAFDPVQAFIMALMVNARHLFYGLSLLKKYRGKGKLKVWTLSSLLGGLIGNLITFDTTGIDFALTALFVVIFLNGWKEKKNRVPALVGMGCSIISIFIFGTEKFIIPAMVMLLMGLTLGRGKLEGEKKKCIYLQEKQCSQS